MTKIRIAVFDATNYPNAIASGVFFVALEDNGHVYAYVLNEDGSSVQIADIDGKLVERWLLTMIHMKMYCGLLRIMDIIIVQQK